MVYTQKYYDTHRESINAKRRERYDSAARKEEYYLNRDLILQKKREDKAMCPLCSIEYGRFYLRKHLLSRHKLPVDECDNMYSDAVHEAIFVKQCNS